MLLSKNRSSIPVAFWPLLLLLAYISAYLDMSKLDGCLRTFSDTWQVSLFWPGLKLEKLCRGSLFVAYRDAYDDVVILKVD